MTPTPAEASAAAIVVGSTPFIGQTASIVIVALFGAFVAVSRSKSVSMVETAKQVARAVAFSVFLTVSAAKLAANYLPLESADLVIPLAFLIALVGDDWFKVKGWAMGWLSRKAKE